MDTPAIAPHGPQPKWRAARDGVPITMVLRHGCDRGGGVPPTQSDGGNDPASPPRR